MESFVYQNVSYVVFQTSSSNNFLAEQVSNVRIARVDASGPPAYYKQINASSDPRKRIESEVHYPTNDSPVIFYVHKAEAGDGEEQGCSVGDNMLRRARTGVPN